jgi:hypothetical protein
MSYIPPPPKEQERPAGRVLLQVLLEADVDPNVPTSSSGEVCAATRLRGDHSL